jgi:hypothetical protein
MHYFYSLLVKLDEDLKIAWRYRDQPASPASFSGREHSFNLLKTIPKENLGK